eukprot:200263-Hanusia_phi.AAC.2
MERWEKEEQGQGKAQEEEAESWLLCLSKFLFRTEGKFPLPPLQRIFFLPWAAAGDQQNIGNPSLALLLLSIAILSLRLVCLTVVQTPLFPGRVRRLLTSRQQRWRSQLGEMSATEEKGNTGSRDVWRCAYIQITDELSFTERERRNVSIGDDDSKGDSAARLQTVHY